MYHPNLCKLAKNKIIDPHYQCCCLNHSLLHGKGVSCVHHNILNHYGLTPVQYVTCNDKRCPKSTATCYWFTNYYDWGWDDKLFVVEVMKSFNQVVPNKLTKA